MGDPRQEKVKSSQQRQLFSLSRSRFAQVKVQDGSIRVRYSKHIIITQYTTVTIPASPLDVRYRSASPVEALRRAGDHGTWYYGIIHGFTGWVKPRGSGAVWAVPRAVDQWRFPGLGVIHGMQR